MTDVFFWVGIGPHRVGSCDFGEITWWAWSERRQEAGRRAQARLDAAEEAQAQGHQKAWGSDEV